MTITARGPVLHGVACYEAWRQLRNCEHEGIAGCDLCGDPAPHDHDPADYGFDDPEDQ